MTFPKYPEYKDPGVEWLGAVPAHWKVRKIAHGFSRIGSGTTPPSNEQKWYEGGSIPWVTTSELRESLILETKKSITDEALSEFTSLQVHPPGSLAIAMYGATIGRLGVFGVSATTNQACCVLSEGKTISSRFAFYWLLAFKNIIISLYATGGGQPNINQEIIASLRLPAPSLADQAHISTFLDHETARIDALVEEQQRLIDLLKEKRQAVISHAVTKGLDPDVPMKDSGVEWLGEVPAHWMVGPLRWYATIQGGVAKGKSYDVGTLTIDLPYLRVANVQDGYVDLSSVNTVTVAVSEVDRYRLQSGDVLMNEGGDNDKLGRGAVWEGEIADCLHQNHVFAIRPNDHLLPHWLSMFTGSSSARAYFYLYSKQSTNLASVSSSNVMSCPLPLPPREEQRQILEFLGRETARIDNLMAEGEKVISFLIERRSALISSAVTGKIDVRGWQPPVGSSVANEARQTEVV
ncbi:restriction endonuclease subunit S [Halomonas sp. BC04]|uniref:restriction endonuclease subunit S n=1 Tax=Halomonas sp. BC04 TaxID=1403540 RepID=UPI0003ED7D25|nr:restriction endonuclease subunit S [Halomonas sp. BC04]EWH03242.1 hypothetical protein Q427_04395 [Halomonas sp. BC04]